MSVSRWTLSLMIAGARFLFFTVTPMTSMVPGT